MEPNNVKRIAVCLLFCLVACGCGGDAVHSYYTPPVQQAQSPLLMTPEQLQAELDAVLDDLFRRPLDVDVHAAWQIVHGIMAFGPEFEVLVDGEPTPALAYILDGGRLRGWDFEPTEYGLRAIMQPGTKEGQGHPDQWLGYLSHCALSPNEEINTAGRTFTLEDLINQTQIDIVPGQEASWTLMGLSTYLAPDAEWTAANGDQWSLERIVSFEAEQDLRTSACGGTHRMYGLTMAVNAYHRGEA